MLQLHPFYYPEGYVGDGEDQEPFENFAGNLDIHDIIINNDHVLNIDNINAQSSIRLFFENMNSGTTPGLADFPLKPEDESVYDN